MIDRTRSSPAGGLWVCLVLLLVAAPFARADSWHFEEVDRIVAFGDVHGAYGALVTTLQSAGVIDEDLSWSGGKTHLVSTGDLLDRGAESRHVMDLMMRLEGEAERAGGRVHQLLGNHEVMNLIGDLRYVADEEFAAFEDIESEDEREAWFQRYREGGPAEMDEAAARQDFLKKAPPGYFAHRRAFRRDGHYGKWLLEKPFMIVINDVAFVHGGAPIYAAEHGIDGINVGLNAELVGYLNASEALVKRGTLSPIVGFKQVPGVLATMLEGGQLPAADIALAQSAIKFSKSPLHGPPGPTWYRGTSRCNRFVEAPTLNAVLAEVGATRVVVGHSTAVSRTVQRRLGDRVFEIDTGMLNRVYGGSGNALVLEGNTVSVVNQDGSEVVELLDQPIQVGYRDTDFSEDDLAQVLETGQIVAVAAEGPDWRLVQVSEGDVSVLASFRALPGRAGFAPELAAFRLDRLLRLGMVPVTVQRNIDGREGTLQFIPGVTLTERERVASGKGQDAACPLRGQYDAMLVFDALVNNVSRTPSSMVYDPDGWLLMLVDNENAFAEFNGDLNQLRRFGALIGDEWQAALRELDDDVLRTELGEVLDSRRLRALGRRRDALIQ
ncbi:MAG: metallophosphoesterase [Gammaproteobacteria bacterium]|nr:metallophosphoesterase [Gammaproteobacteria bacterium]